MIDKETAKKGKQLIGELEEGVKLITFTQETECSFCEQNRELMEDVAELSHKIGFEVYDFVSEKDMVEKYDIDKIPATVVATDSRDFGVRFYGIPSGYEFTSLLEAIKTVSTGDHGLSTETVEKLKNLKKDVRIQVFVTPTCPYCTRAVILTHKLAVASEHVKGEMIEALEFPHLANKYNVMGVPRSIFNEKDFIEGAVPEKIFVDKVFEVVNR